MRRRPPRSTRVRSSAASDVYKRQVYIGFSAFRMLQAPLAGVSTALKFVGVSAETAAAGVRTLTIAASVIGAVITVATLLYSAHAESVRKNTQAANDYTDALRTSNG